MAVRKHGIGSYPDAAAAVGLNPYKSQLELWLEKTGRDAGSAPRAIPTTRKARPTGATSSEPIVANHYARRTGNRVRRDQCRATASGSEAGLDAGPT
ncbi:YqaJ viral recombinase family protein [Pseudomonas aeruginosa]